MIELISKFSFGGNPAQIFHGLRGKDILANWFSKGCYAYLDIFWTHFKKSSNLNKERLRTYTFICFYAYMLIYDKLILFF